MSRTSWVGETLSGRYKIEELLGQGGMSAVYKATDPNLKRVVAVKLIHSHLSTNPDFVRRFEEEAAAVAQLSHPNIIQVHDFNHDGDDYYMVLEFVPGETLQDRLKRLNADGRRLPIQETIKYAINICNAVDYAHKRGMIHRDIKPANIMLNVMGKAILMDFGIAKILGGQQHTATGAVVGTAMYMSPEQIQGERPDERADIYSLGVTLFEMVRGHPPYEADSAMTLMMMHLNDPLPDLRQIDPAIPADIIAIIEKALEKKRENRYQSAAEMSAALQKAQARLQSGAPLAPTRIEAAPENASSPQATRIEDPSPISPDDLGTFIEPPQPQPVNEATYIEPQPAAPISPGRTSGVEQAYRDPETAGSALHETIPPGPSGPGKRNLKPFLLGGGLVIILGLVCLVGGAIFLAPKFLGSANSDILGGASTATSAPPVAALINTSEPTATPAPSATSPPPTSTLRPTQTLPPSLTPTATVPPGILYARINSITIDDSNRYVVEYETFEYTEKLPGTHVHFFFNTVPPDQAGVPGKGPWILYGGPRPFKGYKVSDRPQAATQMCALVANPNHSVQPDSGNCMDLPSQ